MLIGESQRGERSLEVFGYWISYEVTFMFNKMNLNAHVILCFQYHILFIVMAMVIDASSCVDLWYITLLCYWNCLEICVFLGI